MLCISRYLTIGLLAVLVTVNAKAFSLLGPFESWQTAGIGYNPRGGELGGPHALGDEFRWVDGHITYGFDSSFVNYFGPEGIKQVNAAMRIINSLPPLSTITTNDLLNTAKYPLVAWRYNGTAQALNLRDLKSTALSYVLEGLGLGQSERFAWTLRVRSTSTPNLTNYLVFNRNFDPITFSPSPYVNGERYSYRIREFTQPDYADAVEYVVDKAKPSFSSVAGGTFGSAISSSAISLGSYYMNLTRDDVGGLRYLYQRFNQNVEGQASAGSTFIQVTNYDNATVQTNYDLSLFSMRSLTNNAAQLAGLYPGLVITQTLTTVKPAIVVGSVELASGSVPWSPDGANLKLKTNWMQTNIVVYSHKIANVFTNLTSQTSTVDSYDVIRTKDISSSVANPVFLTNQVNGITKLFQHLGTNIPSGSFNIVNRWLYSGAPDFSRFATNPVVPPVELVTFTTNILYAATTPLQVTNYDAAITQRSFDLSLFSLHSVTNTAAQMIALYPGLVITQTLTTVKPVQIIGNLYLKPGSVPWSPDGVNLSLVLATNFLNTNITIYSHKFANTLTNQTAPTSFREIRDVEIRKSILSSVANPTFLTNHINVVNFTNTADGKPVPKGSITFVNRWLADRSPDFSIIPGILPLVQDVSFITNILYAAAAPLQVTNYDNVAVQTNYDLTLFSMRSLSNNAANLIGLYPGLVVTQTLSTVTPVVRIERIYVDTNQVAWSAAGVFLPIVLKTNYVTVNIPVFFHKFANVYTNLVARTSDIIYRDVSRVKGPFSSGSNPTYVTNQVSTTIATNLPTGSINIVNRWLLDGSPDFSRYPIRTEDSTYHLVNSNIGSGTGSSDIVDLNLLANNLLGEDPNSPIGYVRGKFAAATLTAVRNFVNASPETLIAAGNTLRPLLVSDFNKLIDGSVLFNPDVIAAINLRPETFLLYIQGAVGSDLKRLNRMILEDTFGGQILPLLPSVALVQSVTYTTNILYAAVNLIQGTTFRREQIITYTNTEYAGFPITIFNGQSIQREEVASYVSSENAVYPITLFNGQSIQHEEVISSTNVQYAGYPISSVPVGNSLRGGIDKISLTNVVYNDLNPGSFRYTNSYPIYTVTNGVSQVEHVERVQTRPDILFSAADLGTDADGYTPITVRRGSQWIDNTALNTLDGGKEAGSGPGEIAPGLTISFNKILPVHLNVFPGDITESSGGNISGFGSVVGVWGSYDGSTNAPILYPKDITLDLLEKKLFR